ncbi:MAG: MTH1187 family thiamine-binding protein [Gemmataceae bacterium]
MVLLEFSMAPMGKGESVAPYVARCLAIIEKSGLDYELHAMGTILEGEWDEVFDVVRKCHEALAVDCERISVTMKVDSRKGAKGRLAAKVESVEKLVGRPLKTGRKT